MSHVDFLTNIYDEDLDRLHEVVDALFRLEVVPAEEVLLILGLQLMRLEGKQGEL